MLKKQASSSVPVQSKAQPKSQSLTDFQPQPDPKRLLMVNDNLKFLALMQDYLEFLGYEMITANTSLKALEVLERMIPDAMIVDDEILHREGEQLSTKLREKNSQHPQIPVVILDEMGTPNVQLQAQADGYFHVSVKPEEIIAVLQKVLERSPDFVTSTNSDAKSLV